MVLWTPVLAIAVALVAVERLLHVGIFDPALGGDPILFQHLFWFYSHPAVYIMVLPGMGVVAEIVPCFSRRPTFGYKMIAFSSIAIAVIRLPGLGPPHVRLGASRCTPGMIFSVLSFLVAVPSAIKVFNWTATHVQGVDPAGRRRCSMPSGFIGLVHPGRLWTGLMPGPLGGGRSRLTVTRIFVVAHFHYIMGSAVP